MTYHVNIRNAHEAVAALTETLTLLKPLWGTKK